MTSEDWIKVLRERTHKLTSTCAALEITNSLLSKRVEELTRKVQAMATADEIAKGVAEELHKHTVENQRKVNSGMQWLVWTFGLLLTGLQIVTAVFLFRHGGGG